MADLNFEESCPCGTNIKISGYTSEIRLQIQSWRSIHNKHANAIAKAVVENKMHPAYIINTEFPSTAAKKQD